MKEDLPAPPEMGSFVVGVKELDLVILLEPNHGEDIRIALLTVLEGLEEQAIFTTDPLLTS